jgi:hypothetical protein
MEDWITDRAPTKADADSDGDVLMRYSPSESDYVYVHWSYVKNGNPWKHVTPRNHPVEAPSAPKPQPQPGEVWRYRNGKSGTVRANIPSGTSFPIVSDLGKPGGFYAHYPDGRSCADNEDYDLVERLKAAPSPKPPLAVGQVWRRRDNKVVTIDRYDTDHTYGRTHPFRACGFSYTATGMFNYDGVQGFLDLVELLSEAPAPAPNPEPTPPAVEIPLAIRTGAEPFYVLVVSDDASGKPGGNPIVWEHQMPEGTTLRSALQQQRRIGTKYGTSYVAECRIIPELTREVPADA